MRNRLLVVEDDAALARVLSDNLMFAGFHVDCVRDGDAALQSVRRCPPDLIVLDVMLPGRDGFEVCSVLRQGGRTPIVMLTARGQKADKVRGLQLGADDYVTKPFHFEELLARIQAVLRRARPAVDRLVLGDVIIDFVSMQAWTNGHPVHLTHREFEVLRYLAERPSRVVSREELLREIWGYLDSPATRSVDHAIARLRKKIEREPHRPRFLHTVHGDGYLLNIRSPA
jgi:two-component system alkaline phosphatase synthesis response regulator PhoP